MIVAIKRWLPEAADARSFVSSYTLTLAAAAVNNDPDILAGKTLGVISVNWSDGFAQFPVAFDRGAASEISLTLSLASASAAQNLKISGEGFAVGAIVSLFWSVVAD